MPLNPRERTLVKLAVDVFCEAMEATGTARVDTSAVRLTLDVLLAHRAERLDLADPSSVAAARFTIALQNF